jgi:hypothetical protein
VTLDRLVYELSAPQHLSQCALDSRSVVVVDEASMVDTRRLVRLLEIAERAGAKGVLPGRPLFSRASMPSSGLSHEPRGGCAPGAPYTRLKRQ